MAKYFLIGEEGQESVWLVDLENKTVEKFDSSQVSQADVDQEDLLANFGEVRKQGFSIISGVNLAVAAERRSTVSAHHRYENH